MSEINYNSLLKKVDNSFENLIAGDHLMYSALLDSLPGEVVVIDSNKKIVYANSKFSETYGNDIIGNSIEKIEKETTLPRLLESKLQTQLTLILKNRICFQGNILRDGINEGALQISVPSDEIYNNIRDDPSYSQLKDDVNTLFQTNWDVIYASDKNGITLEVSSASNILWGMSPKQMIGKSVYELEKKHIYSPSITRLVLETKKRVQAIQTTATGKKLLVLGTPIKDKNGEIIRVINTSRLIVGEDALKAELEETKMLLEGYKRELEYVVFKDSKETSFISSSPQMEKIISLALKVSDTDISVLISGESGTGKEVLASYIYVHSRRAKKPYVKINCGAIPPNLLESELFGYEKGAFTGAEKKGKPGMFEVADQGTIFLDEIGEMPMELQVKLLRVIQEGELMRVGGTVPVKVDVRIISATNKDLSEEVKKGTFRKDLFYRLNVVPIKIPALRERKDDILPLSLFFLEKYNKQYFQSKNFSSEVINKFMNYKWDGNIRELQNTIERMVVLSTDDLLLARDLPDSFFDSDSADSVQIKEIMSIKDAQKIVEQKLIDMAYKKYKTTTRIAEVLGVNQSTISRKLREMNE